MVLIELYYKGTYKDGGSKSCRDHKGKSYWRDFSISSKKNPSKYGKLYEGDINDKNPKLAKGNFIIENEIIKQ